MYFVAKRAGNRCDMMLGCCLVSIGSWAEDKEANAFNAKTHCGAFISLVLSAQGHGLGSAFLIDAL
jgi:hypothetical protein